MRIGIVDLDTSHPQNWIPIEREMGHDIVADTASLDLAGPADEERDVMAGFPDVGFRAS